MTGLDRRFGPQPRTEPTATPGLLIDDTNTVYVVLPDGTRVALPGSGSGTVTEITSDDHSVTITNPDGPIVDLSVAGGGFPNPFPDPVEFESTMQIDGVTTLGDELIVTDLGVDDPNFVALHVGDADGTVVADALWPQGLNFVYQDVTDPGSLFSGSFCFDVGHTNLYVSTSDANAVDATPLLDDYADGDHLFIQTPNGSKYEGTLGTADKGDPSFYAFPWTELTAINAPFATGLTCGFLIQRAAGGGGGGGSPGVPWVYDAGTTSPPPDPGTFITDSPGDFTGVSQITFSNTDADSFDLTDWLAVVFTTESVTSAIFYIAAEDDDSQLVTFQVDGVDPGSGFYSFDVSYLAGVTTFTDAIRLRAWFASSGGDGTNGVSPGVPFEFLPGDTPPPIAGGILSDNQGDLPSSAHLYISTLDENGNDTTGWLEAIDEIPGSTGILYLRDLTDPAVTATFSFQTVTPASGYVDVETTWLAGSTSISGGHECEVIISLGGPEGTPGSTWYNGSGAPDEGLGVDGDYYLDDDTGDVYQKLPLGVPVAPTFVAASYATGSAGQLSIAAPSGLADGDFMILIASQVSGAPDLTGDGWTALDSGGFSGNGGAATENWQVWTKFASSQADPYAPNGYTQYSGMVWLAYRGVDPVSAVDDYASVNIIANTTTLTSPSITAALVNEMIVAGVIEMIDSSSVSTAFTPPGGYTEREDQYFGTLRAGYSAADEVSLTDGTIGPVSFTATAPVAQSQAGSCRVLLMGLEGIASGGWTIVANIMGPAGPRVVQAKVVADDTVVATGDGQMILCVPAEFDGLSLTAAEAYVTTVSGSGTPTIQIRNVTTANDMLSTPITIDASEFTSYTAATPPVIDGAHAGVSTADLIAVDVDDAGSGAQGLGVILTFG